ncbi:hypothetical protein B0H13DRAFT_1867681 [Mycena leptocephala]|nr:hypothetical protein B0H13DRAFT_1867681 [Mycena leptocephala]
MYSKFGRDSVCSYATEQIIFYRTTGAFTFQGVPLGVVWLSRVARDASLIAAVESAVYIYGIDWLDDSNVTFAMQNPPLMGFHYWMGAGYAYDGLFFSAAVQHIVTWVNTPGVADNVGMLFDYALVTVDQPQSSSASGSSTSLSDVPPPSHKSKSKTGAIVGAVVGVGALALLGAAHIFWRRRQSTDAMRYTVEPYQPHPNANGPFTPGNIFFPFSAVKPFGKMVHQKENGAQSGPRTFKTDVFQGRVLRKGGPKVNEKHLRAVVYIGTGQKAADHNISPSRVEARKF